MASRLDRVVAVEPAPSAWARAGGSALAFAVVAVALASPPASAALQLSNPRPVNIPGVTLDKDDIVGRIRGADFDPRTGHLWLIGDFLIPDPLDPDPDSARPVDIVEYDPVAKATIRTLNVRQTQAFGNRGFAGSLAVHPTNGNLFVGWFQQVNDAPDHGGFAEFSQSGALLSNGDRGGDFYAPGATFDAAGNLVLVHIGSPVYRFDPVTRELLSKEPIHDTFPGQNYLSADIDPVTGRLVLSGTSTGIIEFDPSTLVARATTEETQFLPPPGPLVPVHGRVEALAFSRAGDQVYLGGDFGLIVLDRAVPEPSVVVGALVLLGCARRSPRRMTRGATPHTGDVPIP